MTEIITIAVNKGGSGKSTLATNIAGILSNEYDKKVLIVDTDAQGNIGVSFGVDPDSLEGNTIYEVLLDQINVEKAIKEVTDQVHIIPANSDMNFFDYEVLTRLEDYENVYQIMKKALWKVTPEYDYILIDTPPSLGLVTLNALSVADSVIIPFEPEYYSAKGLMKIVKAIKDLGVKQNPDLEILGVVANKVDYRTSLHTEMVKLSRRYCEANSINMFRTVIPKSIRVASSVPENQMPLTMSPLIRDGKRLYDIYTELVKEIVTNG